MGSSGRIQRMQVRDGMLLGSNRSRLEVFANNVERGGVAAFRNTGGVLLVGNTIAEGLECYENAPVPLGGNNVVRGVAGGQCVDLRPEAPQSVPPAAPPAPAPTTPTPTTPDTGGSTTTPTPTTTPSTSFVPEPEGGGGAFGWISLL